MLESWTTGGWGDLPGLPVDQWWIGVKLWSLCPVLCPWRHIASINWCSWNLIPLFTWWTAAIVPIIPILFPSLPAGEDNQWRVCGRRLEGFSKVDTESKTKETRGEWGRVVWLIQPTGCGHVLNMIWATNREGTEVGGIGSCFWARGHTTKLTWHQVSWVHLGESSFYRSAEFPSYDLLCATNINHFQHIFWVINERKMKQWVKKHILHFSATLQ